MFVPEAHVLLLRMSLERGFERVQDRAVARVPDGVHIHLEPVFDPVERALANDRGVGDPQAGVAGVVDVGLEQLGAT